MDHSASGSGSVVDAAEALIEEARNRQRRRWLGRGGAIIVALGLSGGLLIAASSSGPGVSPIRHAGSNYLNGSPVAAHTVVVKGEFVTAGGPPGAAATKVYGTIRFVADRTQKSYDTKSRDGHWKIEVPSGSYVVQGRSTIVGDGRSWSQPIFVSLSARKSIKKILVFSSIR